MSSKPEFEGWAVIEIMGHRRLAGMVREVTIAGGAFLRIDIPSEPPITQYYGSSALFSVTPTTEEDARRITKEAWAPAHRYALPAASDDDDDGDDDDDRAAAAAALDSDDEDRPW